MLAQMSCTELSEWEQFYAVEYFQTDLIDTHFSRLSHHITDMVCKDHGLTPQISACSIPRYVRKRTPKRPTRP
jgi:hypothetical protein